MENTVQDPWEVCLKSYKVHEESYAFINGLAAQSVQPFHKYTLEEAREVFPAVFNAAAGEIEFDGEVEELVIPSPYVTSGILTSVYKARNRAANPAILVYFHGGGLIILDRKSVETALKTIARDAGCIVVNVEYRLLNGPGKDYDPFNDAVTATEWVLANKKRVGGSPSSKVGVGGDSAGGQIAISVTNDVQGLDLQILMYPHADTVLNFPSVTEFKNVPGLSKADIDWFVHWTSLELPHQLTDPRINAMARTNLELSPTTLIVAAQLDTLRDSGVAYAKKLRAAGVEVQLETIEGVPHAFFGMCAIFKTKCPEAYGHVVKFIKKFQ
uniref:Alpha/beta hydrolase fold-3 domain-containing protein n=1 Tax=Arion vulgaris TaxID=1028688 RepID=A0A0B7BLZ9_9EUPU